MAVRFKTQAEFEEEFGVDWRANVPAGWSTEMDNMLGQPIADDVAEDMFRTFNRSGNTYRYRRSNISPQMITDDDSIIV